MAQLGAVSGSRIVLAHAAPFRLGEVEVYPATRQLIRNGRSETLEPRVMQVLVALAEARGAVLTRDELIERCWGGLIVSENAINRVISRIRQVALDFGMDSFQLETITKVGYRMVVAQNGAPPGHGQVDAHEPDCRERARASTQLNARPSRRTLFGAAIAVAAAGGAGGIFLWRGRGGHEPSPAALELFRRGELAQRQALPEQTRQAISYFQQAVAADPLFARAWGALALSYRHALEGSGQMESGSLPGLIQSAARRALTLDPANVDARLALIIAKPHYRNWPRMEVELRRLAEDHPNHWLLRGQIGVLLQDVGRLTESIAHSEAALATDPFLPMGHGFLARGLSYAGRIQEADEVLDRALERWPAHPVIWNLRYNLLLFSKRPGSAAAFVMDPAAHPEGASPGEIDLRVTLARAVEGREPKDLDASVAAYRALALKDVRNIPMASAAFALLGRPDLIFPLLERYFFGKGPLGDPLPPPGPFDRRYTVALFAPPIAALRDDPRYKDLLRRVGLEHYWRTTKSRPDFRKQA